MILRTIMAINSFLILTQRMIGLYLIFPFLPISFKKNSLLEFLYAFIYQNFYLSFQLPSHLMLLPKNRDQFAISSNPYHENICDLFALLRCPHYAVISSDFLETFASIRRNIMLVNSLQTGLIRAPVIGSIYKDYKATRNSCEQWQTKTIGLFACAPF